MKKSVPYIKLFGWRIYFSQGPMKRKNASEQKCVNQRKRHTRFLNKTRKRRYRQVGGCCQLCGGRFQFDEMELHHILPVSCFPKMGMKSDNLLLICSQCHYLVHNDPVMNVTLMSRLAAQRGFDLSKRYHHIAISRWNTQKRLKTETT